MNVHNRLLKTQLRVKQAKSNHRAHVANVLSSRLAFKVTLRDLVEALELNNQEGIEYYIKQAKKYLQS